MLLLSPAIAGAEEMLPFAKSPESGAPGSGAGSFRFPEGVAVQRGLPGHVFVVDRDAQRVSELSPWGAFVKAWGWGVRDGSAALQTCTGATGCQAGGEGVAAGQLRVPQAVGVDSAGNVYVMEQGNRRVQKFAPGSEGGEAQFLLAFGWGVRNGAAEAQSCGPAAVPPSAGCQAGIEGGGAGQFGSGPFSRRMAVCPSGQVFVGEGERVQRFGSAGAFEEAIGMPAGKSVRALAADSACNLYVAFVGEAEARKLKPTGPTAEFLAPAFPPENSSVRPRALAVDGSNNLYVAVDANGGEPERVYEYDATGKCLDCGSEGEEGKAGFDRSPTSQLMSVGATSACGPDDAYLAHFSPLGTGQAFVRVFGEHPNPAACKPPLRPPSIDAQFAASVETTTASLRAEINPHFWSGPVGTTTYRLQYGTAACLAAEDWEAPCVSELPAPPGRTLEGGAVGEDVRTPAIVLQGLAPATSYRYRFVAEGSGAPGEPVEGLGGVPGTSGIDAGFRTYAPPKAEPCPANEAFRASASSLLPDCRAYEMVSPLDKEGGDILSLLEGSTNLPAILQQSSVDGDRVAYGSYRSFGGAESAPYTTQYVASREAGVAWKTHPISPPHEKAIYESPINLDTEFRAFSPDLCQSWLQSFAEPPLAAGAPAGVSDLYRRGDEECGGPSYEPLNRTPPPNLTSTFSMELQGLSADGAVAAFKANDVLAAGGTAGVDLGGLAQLYVAGGGEERFACVLPGGVNWTGACTAGGTVGNVGGGRNRAANVTGALSADGRRLYWTAAPAGPNAPGTGKIYERVNPLGEGPECEEGSPCTITVSAAAEAEAGTSASQFQAAAKNGSRALFITGGRLYEFRTEDKSTHPIAGEVLGLVGASEDASRVYLASEEALGGENAEHQAAVAGDANLYLHEGGDPGSFRFIGALAGADLASLSPITPEFSLHTARVSPDGQAAAFMSAAALTGYDNTDAASGEADAEVFLYDAAAGGGAGALRCASCNPGGARPHGRLYKEGGTMQAAAKIPVPENVLYAARVLAPDGRRLYFTSFDGLVPADTNGRADVYQWEAVGRGTCTQASPSYSPENGGCVDLISSGRAALDSELTDASPSGDDVFFTTIASLVPQDYGLRDVYDARVGGGLPSPPPPAPECEAEACQQPPAAPEFATPATLGNEGPANKRQKKKKHHHKKHKKAAKHAKHKKHQRQRGGAAR